MTVTSSIGADAATFGDQALMELVFSGTETADGTTYNWVYRLSGAASGAPTVTATKTAAGASEQDTHDTTADFVQNRAANIMQTMPDMSGFLGGEGFATRGLNFNATNGNFALSFDGTLTPHSSSKNFAGKTEVWGRLRAVGSQSGTSNAATYVGYLGTHRFVSENLLFGGMLQVDYSSETESTAGSTGSGYGYMIGPYVAGKIAGSNLDFEAQALWGQSFNNISPIGTYNDAYTTERGMIRGKISGSFKRGAWTIKPNASVSYFSEVQAAYTDSLATTISSQTITLGEVRVGPEFSRTFRTGSGLGIDTRIGLAAVTNFNVSSTSGSQAFALGDGDVRTRVDLGLATATRNGWNFSADLFYDGLGVTDYQAYGGSVWAKLRF